MDGTTFQRVLAIVLRDYQAEDWTQDRAPFEVLVSVVLSQNTTVQNERRALENLRVAIGITPERIASAPLEELEGAIRPAGLYASKARWLRGIAQHLVDRHESNVRDLIHPPLDRAREALMHLDGIGPKTADVV
ncbi:MAG: endonuclease III, partial [Thermoplasmata archaeon]